MTERSPRHYNTNLTVTILLLSAVILVRLWAEGMRHNNMKGFWISTLHVIIVAIGAFLSLRKASSDA